jgi:hypothetical protein
MSDYLLSLIRTAVPAAAGAVVGWLATLGLELGAEAEAGLVLFLGALGTTVYYALVRALEQRWPGIGKLLGASRQPEYAPEYVAEVRGRMA